MATYPNIFVHACDFSPQAIDLVKAHKDFKSHRINAFICDLTKDDLTQNVLPSSVDIVTMIFVLSAVSPEKMPLMLQNIRKVLKPNGHVLLRDYATGDLAQERFICKDQEISENFYVRGDGTRAFYFSKEYLTDLLKTNGFDVEDISVYCRKVENRSREIVMNRRWIQTVFRLGNFPSMRNQESENKGNVISQEDGKCRIKNALEMSETESVNGVEIDMSESIALEMFGILSSVDDSETLEIQLGENAFKIQVLAKEYQHTCKSTGLMLWESARMMSYLLVENPSIVSGRRVLELGCGSSGICSMISARYADIVVATDGDIKVLDLLHRSISSNVQPIFLDKLIVKRLEWGNKEHVEAIEELYHDQGFDVILGTDVTYVHEAISPLFQTARMLISTRCHVMFKPALILCQVPRRVDECFVLSTAAKHGFKLVDRWPKESKFHTQTSDIIKSWFTKDYLVRDFRNASLNILYFEI